MSNITPNRGAAGKIMTNGFHWLPDALVKKFAGIRFYMANQFIMRGGKFYRTTILSSTNTICLGFR